MTQPKMIHLIGCYRIALWSTRPPRIFGVRTIKDKTHVTEVRLRVTAGTLVARLMLGEPPRPRRQVSQTVPRLLRAAGLVLPGPPGHVLISDDGSCSMRSLHWLEPGDAVRFKRWHRPLTELNSEPARLTFAATACALANDHVATQPEST